MKPKLEKLTLHPTAKHFFFSHFRPAAVFDGRQRKWNNYCDIKDERPLTLLIS